MARALAVRWLHEALQRSPSALAPELIPLFGSRARGAESRRLDVDLIVVWQTDGARSQQMALFPDDRPAPELALAVVQVRLNELSLHHPRQFGGCWLALRLWEQLDLDDFRAGKLRPSRKGTRWLNVLKVLVCQRLLAPGSEWRLHRQWFGETALAELLGEDLGVAEKDALYRCPPLRGLHRLLPAGDPERSRSANSLLG